jgi:Ni/Co efflux regulator RcnB
MHRALIGIFLAATMATPLAAQSADEPEANSEPAYRQGGGDDRVQRRESSRSRSRSGGLEASVEPAAVAPQREDRRERRRSERRDRDHGATHREYREEHDALHRNNPTRTEHRRFHREVNRDHNRWHERWDHDWRRDSRYDWERYRYSNRNLYRVGRYDSPYRGHRYRPFSIGFRLGPDYYSHRYWINDPWRYRLPHAYAGTRWVRYYDDVLLVDLFTGRVVDVIYDFFW